MNTIRRPCADSGALLYMDGHLLTYLLTYRTAGTSAKALTDREYGELTVIGGGREGSILGCLRVSEQVSTEDVM